MKTALLTRTNRVELRETPIPEPGPGEVLLRVRAVGICGSDTHFFAGLRDHEPDTTYPFVLGHEFAGEVAQAGPGAESFQSGTRVLCSPDLPCGKCEWCARGEENVCPDVRFCASGGVPGCLSEYRVVHNSQLHPIPDTMTFAEATLCEPLAIGLHIIDNLVRPEGGESFAVIGAGPIGLVSAFCARRRGAGEVYVSDRIRTRTEAAMSYGASKTHPAESDTDFAEFIDSETGARGVDVVIEAGGENSSITQAPHLARIHGLVIIEGIPPAGEALIPVDAARRKELKMIFGRRSLNKTHEALDLIGSGGFDARAMITHEFPIEETQKAFELCRDYRDGVIKAIVFP